MKYYIKIVILSILALASCQKQEAIQIYEVPSTESRTITLNDALDNLQSLRSELFPETKTSLNDVQSIDVFGKIKTKSSVSSLPDTLLYLVNFKEGGFAILAGQTKLLYPVFCITDEGALSSNQMEEALNKLNEDFSTKANIEGEEFEDCGEVVVPMMILSSAINQMEMTQNESFEYDTVTKANTYRDITKCGPFLKTKWHQESPFNDFHKKGYPAGCVAIATAQILEFNRKYDTSNINQRFDWTLLETVNNCSNVYYYGSASAKQEASKLLEYVGNKDNCNITYKSGGSSGNADGAKRTFKNFKYCNVDKSLGFEKNDRNKVIAQLTRGLPVYMDGSYKLSSGHAWVIDGLYVREVLDANTHDHVRTENLFHINWGWLGQSDGYYTQGVFDTSQRVDTEAGVDTGHMSSRHQYTWNYRTIVYDLE